MENEVKEIQEYFEKKGLVATETSIVNAALEIACRRDLLYDLLFVRNSGSIKETSSKEDKLEANKDEEVKDKVEEVQGYLNRRGIDVADTRIINAAIDLARRWGGNAVFIGELQKVKSK